MADAPQEPLTTDIPEKLYAVRVMNWLDWRTAGLTFVDAARKLAAHELKDIGTDWQVTSSGSVAPYAVAYAIGVEDLLKALMVKRGVTEGAASGLQLVNADGTLGRDLLSHKANALWDKAKPSATRTDAMKRLLDWLTDLREAGGYPVPTRMGKNPRALYHEFPRLAERIEDLVGLLDADLAPTFI
jgi:hypothetical protein